MPGTVLNGVFEEATELTKHVSRSGAAIAFYPAEALIHAT